MEKTVDEMEAGRELDALIAERVFGLIRNGGGWSPHDARTGITRDVSLPLRYYSARVEDAWAVVEALKGDRHLVEIHVCDTSHVRALPTYTDDEPYYDYTCYIDPEMLGDEMVGGFVAGADTLPLAICRAALKAVS